MLVARHHPLLRRVCVMATGDKALQRTSKKAKRTPFGPLRCPACNTDLFKLQTFRKHVGNCCPDLLERVPQPDDPSNADDVAWGAWVTQAREANEGMFDQVLDIAFRRVDADGNPIKQGPDVVLAEMKHLRTEERAKRLIKAAGKAIPMPADHDPIDVIHEDDTLLGLNKPPFTITAPKHRFEGGSMVNRVYGNTGKLPFVVHRLDMNTSGVLLFAKSSKSASAMHEQFRNKTPRKTYLALVLGVPTWDRSEYTTIDAPIGQSPIEKVARTVVPAAAADGKEAATEFKVLASSQSPVDFGPYKTAICMEPETKERFDRGEITHAALVECRPLTGRTHQIRVHLAHAGFPIIGDDLYGVTGPCIDRHALHAASIRFKHPRDMEAAAAEVEVEDEDRTGEPFVVSAPLPADFQSALKTLRINV